MSLLTTHKRKRSLRTSQCILPEKKDQVEMDPSRNVTNLTLCLDPDISEKENVVESIKNLKSESFPENYLEWKTILKSSCELASEINKYICNERQIKRGVVYNPEFDNYHFPIHSYSKESSICQENISIQCLEHQYDDSKSRRFSQEEYFYYCNISPAIHIRKTFNELYVSSETLQETQDAIRNDLCAICNKPEESFPFLTCSNCKSIAHPPCVEISVELEKVIRNYNWQCMECKTCQVCHKGDKEKKFMFCDKCDRGYHTYCVGLKKLPTGRWICNSCGKCASCGSTKPGDDPSLHWKHEYTKPKDESQEPIFLQTLCVSCSRLFRNGDYCPICLKVYGYSDDVKMICCDECDRWIHIECDDIDPLQYEEMENKAYSCKICRKNILEKVLVLK